jgi:hypothetical protein
MQTYSGPCFAVCLSLTHPHTHSLTTTHTYPVIQVLALGVHIYMAHMSWTVEVTTGPTTHPNTRISKYINPIVLTLITVPRYPNDRRCAYGCARFNPGIT